MIEFKINAGDLLTAFIALLALGYTIYSTIENQRKSVLPFFVIEPLKTKMKLPDFSEEATPDYRILITKENKVIRLEKWGEKEKNIIKQKVPIGFAWTEKYNLPVTMSLINTGKNVAVSFCLVLDGKTLLPQQISVSEKVIISVLLEDKLSTSHFSIRFRDIYGNQYEEKIEFYEGRLYLNPSLRKIRFSKRKDARQKRESRNLIHEQNESEK